MNNKKSFKSKIILLFVILTLVSICCTIAKAGNVSAILDNYFTQTGNNGFIIYQVNYESDGPGGSKQHGVCFRLPNAIGQDAYVDPNGRGLLIDGTEVVQMDLSFSYKNFSWKKSNFAPTRTDDGESFIYPPNLMIKEEDGIKKVYYEDEYVDTWDNFVAGVSIKVEVKNPDQKTYNISPGSMPTKEKSAGKFFLIAWLEWIADQAISILSNILTKLLLRIGRALHELIILIFGESVSLDKVVYNKVSKLDINFWKAGAVTDPSEASLGQLLSPLVSYWYGKFQGIVLIIYLAMLLFAGIKILLSSTAGSVEKVKELLSSWILGVVLLIFFPTCMKYIVEINESMVGLVEEASTNISNNGEKIDAMDKIRNMADKYSNIPLCIVYLIMLGQLVVLLAVYYKRAFTIAYLIVIFPVVQGFYIYEKVQKGKGSRALTNWVKEFCVAVFLQLVHAVVYSVLVEGVLSTFKEEADGALSGNVILYVFCVTFLFKAEAIVKSIFNVRSPGNAIGDAIATAATLGVVTKQAKGILGGSKNNSKAEDEDSKDADKHAANVKQMESNASQKNKEEANKKNDEGDKKPSDGGSGAGAGSGDGTSEGESDKKPSGKPSEKGAPDDSDSKDKESSGENTLPPPADDKEAQRNAALKEAEQAKEVLAHIASQKKKKSVPTKIAKGIVSGAMRTTAITAGVLSGLATGDVQKAVSNAVVFDGTAKRMARGVNKLTGAAANRMGGAIMRAKVKHGGYNKQLKKAGVNVDLIYGNEKDKAVQKALGQFASAQRRGGDALGEMKWAKAVNTKLTEKESRDRTTEKK